MSKITDNTAFAPEKQAVNPGTFLRQAREARGISHDYLRQQLGLTNTLFDALEADEHERLPSPVYVRGYLKRYAELVGERVAPVLAAHKRHLEENGLAEPPPREEPPPQRPLKVMIVSALGLLLATSLVFGAILTDDKMAEEPAQSVAEVESVEEPSANGEPSAKQGQSANEASQTEHLNLRFSTDSWVEVVDARDHILAVSLQREGTELALEGKPPFAVTLGYGPGVSVSHDGEKVAFEPDPETNSARFIVGK